MTKSEIRIKIMGLEGERAALEHQKFESKTPDQSGKLASQIAEVKFEIEDLHDLLQELDHERVEAKRRAEREVEKAEREEEAAKREEERLRRDLERNKPPTPDMVLEHLGNMLTLAEVVIDNPKMQDMITKFMRLSIRAVLDGGIIELAKALPATRIAIESK